MDTYSSQGFQQNTSSVWQLPIFTSGGERDEVKWSFFSEKTMQWQGLVSDQVSQKLCFYSQSLHNSASMKLIIIIAYFLLKL